MYRNAQLKPLVSRIAHLFHYLFKIFVLGDLGSINVFQISIYILVFIASCRRGIFAQSTPRGSSAISHGDKPKMKFNFVKTHRVKRLVRSHFTSPRAFLNEDSPLQSPHPLAPATHQKRENQPNQQINYSETTCVVRRGVKCQTELEFPAFIVKPRGEG